MIERGSHILVGVSGGADSVCLLLLLCELRKRWGLWLTAVHVEHGIRGEDSLRDAAFTEKLCRKHGENVETGFLKKLYRDLDTYGTLYVLRHGVVDAPAKLSLCYFKPASGMNQTSQALYEKNILSITRQVHYSLKNENSIDVVLFINGLPVATVELKNPITGQTVENAKRQYMKDRDPRELLLSFKARCLVHFAVDTEEVWMTTKLNGINTYFLPFNKGNNGGKGNPVGNSTYRTSYLWEEVLQKDSLLDIVQRFIHLQEDKKNPKKSVMIFPRYHQLDVVRKLVADVYANGTGHNYLIQHSAGSGKSNSITWLAHQLIGLESDDGELLVDSVIVVTDRVVLDKQIRDNIKQFMQVSSTVAWAKHSSDLRKAIQAGKRIIITTVEKFPFVLSDIGTQHKDNRFAIIIDEAHSGQSGRTSAKMNLALSGLASEEEQDNEDKINAMCEGRKLLKNASYFAFTATPKNKTLETFGTPYQEGDKIKHRPFHVYTMKQAIQEGFILDVLKYYTPIDSFYRLKKTVEDDPLYDKKKAQKKLRAFVENQSFTVEQKAEMMVSHFHEQVIAKGKIGGKARAMIITSNIERCIEYYYAVNRCLAARHSPYKAIIAFSGEKEFHGQQPALTSAGLNGFPDNKIQKTFKQDPYRFLIVADMFQTGYDEPLLHTMYVDKPLSDIKAVQTLSRLNRAHPQKHDTFVLDFANDSATIVEAFSRYYRTTLLSDETDPNKLYDLIAAMEEYQVFTQDHVEKLVNLYLDGAERDRLDPILDACAAAYKELDVDGQIKFKSAAKSFVRTYGFLGAILPYGNPDWEKLSIFLNLLIPKLPSPPEDDFTQGILEAIDLDSYRLEAKECISLVLQDEDAEVAPVPTGQIGVKKEPEMDLLSAILTTFNDMFGNIDWNDADNKKF